MSALTSISVIFIFLIGAQGSNHTNGEKNILFNRDHYGEEKLEVNRKLDEIALKVCPNHTEEVQKKVKDYENCAANIDEDNKTICKVVEENLENCAKPLIKYYETCVPEKSKGIPTYVLETAEHLVKYVCDDIDGREILELGNPCIARKDHGETKRCINRINREIVNKYSHQNPPQMEEICLFIKDFQDCFDKHVDRFCKNNITRKTYKGMYKVFMCTSAKM